nr:MAG TPA: hypothetical protein [Caudoviricetes sp.]
MRRILLKVPTMTLILYSQVHIIFSFSFYVIV